MKKHVNKIGIITCSLLLLFLPAGCAEFAEGFREGYYGEDYKSAPGAASEKAAKSNPQRQVSPSRAGSCWSCDGTGRIPCNFCNGGRLRCPNCNGCGRVIAQHLKRYVPDRPPSEGGGLRFGRRVETCLQCSGQGTTKCHWCRGYGSRRCGSCGGTGRN